ncbi:MAG: hypothetical protein RLY93_20710 [Sumerlaeia bacterium]
MAVADHISLLAVSITAKRPGISLADYEALFRSYYRGQLQAPEGDLAESQHFHLKGFVRFDFQAETAHPEPGGLAELKRYVAAERKRKWAESVLIGILAEAGGPLSLAKAEEEVLRRGGNELLAFFPFIENRRGAPDIPGVVRSRRRGKGGAEIVELGLCPVERALYLAGKFDEAAKATATDDLPEPKSREEMASDALAEVRTYRAENPKATWRETAAHLNEAGLFRGDGEDWTPQSLHAFFFRRQEREGGER